jgi:hypothetical protein
MRGEGSDTLLIDFDIGKTEWAIQRRIREAREAATVPLPSLSGFSSDEEDQVMERMTLGDYGRLDNLDEVA